MKAIIYPQEKCCSQTVVDHSGMYNPTFDHIVVEESDDECPSVYLSMLCEKGEYADSYCQANLSPEEAKVIGYSLIRAAKLLQDK